MTDGYAALNDGNAAKCHSFSVVAAAAAAVNAADADDGDDRQYALDDHMAAVQHVPHVAAAAAAGAVAPPDPWKRTVPVYCCCCYNDPAYSYAPAVAACHSRRLRNAAVEAHHLC